MDSLYALMAVVLAYLMGSLSFAVIVSRVMGLKDPRSYGSNNPGATNVLRSGSKKAAIATLLLDAIKGWLPVVLVKWYGKDYGLDDAVVAGAAFAAFLGHLFPVFFKFKGGKGVATAAGALLGIDWLLGLATLATWLIVAFAFRYSSLAALVSALFAPFYFGLLFGLDEVEKLLAVLAMSALLLFRHRSNIANLIAGKESRLGSKAEAAKPAAKTAAKTASKKH